MFVSVQWLKTYKGTTVLLFKTLGLKHSLTLNMLIYLPASRVFCRGRFAVVTMYVHSALSVALRFGPGPLICLVEDTITCVRHVSRVAVSDVMVLLRHEACRMSVVSFFSDPFRVATCIAGLGLDTCNQKYVFKQMKYIHHILFSTTSCQLEASKNPLLFLVYTSCNISFNITSYNILKYVTRVSKTHSVINISLAFHFRKLERCISSQVFLFYLNFKYYIYIYIAASVV